MTTTTIGLADLSEATKDYLRNEVTVELVRVTDSVGTGERGVIELVFTNSTRNRGVTLHDVTVHLTVDAPAVLRLSADLPTAWEARRTGSRSDPLLDHDELVEEMFIFFPQDIENTSLDDVLDPGDALRVEVPYEGRRRGTSGVTAHLHGSVTFADLFPRTNGRSPDISIDIVS